MKNLQPLIKRTLPYVALMLMLVQLLLMLVSWIYSAASPTSEVRSLLSEQGLRWFLSHFAQMIGTPLLAWLLLGSMALGCLRHCGILSLPSLRRHSYRERRALMFTLLLALVVVGVVSLLAFVPHAVLLSATGSLWPSPFSASLLPLLCFSVILLSAVYGIVAGHFADLHDVYNALLDGIRWGAPLFLFYVLVIQIYDSLLYILP
jgi:aminobenzoyl-glutamate transport protein